MLNWKINMMKLVEITDKLGQPVFVGSRVMFYNNIYIVQELGKPNPRNHGYVRMILESKSKTTRSVTKHSSDMVVVHQK